MDSSNRRDGRTTLRGTQFPDREIESNAPTRSSERGGSPESVLIYRRRLQRLLGDRPRVRYEHRDQRSGNIEFAGGPSFRTPQGLALRSRPAGEASNHLEVRRLRAVRAERRWEKARR